VAERPNTNLSRFRSDDGCVELYAREDVARSLVEAGALRNVALAELEVAHDRGRMGRGSLVQIDLPGRVPLLVKTLRHGGILGPVLGAHYLGSRRLLRAIELILHLERHAVATAKMVFGRVRRSSRLSACVHLELCTEQIGEAVDLLQALRNEEPGSRRRRRSIAACASLVRALHQAGVFHVDLHPRNILVERNSLDRAWILDLDGSRVVADLEPRSVIENFERLFRSLVKEGLFPGKVSRAEMGRFLQAYEAQEWRARWRATARRFALRVPFHRLAWWAGRALNRVLDR